MSKTLFWACVLTVMIPMQALIAAPVKLDGVAAIVDSQPILESDIETRFKVIKDRIPGGVYTADVRRQILTQMIDEAVQINHAVRSGIRINSSEVDKAVLNVANRMELTLSSFQSLLAQQGIEYGRYRSQIENEILINTIKQQTIRNRITITDQEINDFLESPQSLAQNKNEVRLRHIIIRSKDTVSAKTKIEEIKAKIQTENDFINLAISESDGQFAVQGGDIGWRPLNQLPAIFVRELTTKDGQLLGPIQSNAGFHLLWVVDKRVPDSETQQQTKARHILVRPNAIRNEDQTKNLIDQLYSRLQRGEDFTALAKEFSEDDGSALKGGDLDWVTPGSMVPAFEQEMNRLPVNQYSRPFKTQFGWHIVTVDGRRNMNISEQLQRSNAEKALIAQKQDITLSNWLDELKAQAFIDIK